MSLAVTFAQAAAGDDSAIDAAASAFESLRSAEPANPVVTAYAGASAALQAETALASLKKMSLAEDGLALFRQVAGDADAGPRRGDRARHAGLARGALRRRQHLPRRALVHEPRRARQEAPRRLLASPLLDQAPLPFQGSVWLRAAELAAKDRRADGPRRWTH